MKYRSLLFNLKDGSNPELRARVLMGDIPPAKLVRMSSENLASRVRLCLSCHVIMTRRLKMARSYSHVMRMQ